MFEHSGGQRGARADPVDERVLVVSVRTSADGAEAVDRGNADARGEVAVGTSADRNRPHFRQALTVGNVLRQFDQRPAGALFHGRAVDAAGQFDLRAGQMRVERVQCRVDSQLFGDCQCARINVELCFGGHGVGGGAGSQSCGDDGRSDFGGVQLFHTEDLVGDLSRGVDTSLRFHTGVGSPTGDVEAVEGNAFAGGFELTVGPAGFEHQSG